jgi:hypothetical protein
MLAKKNRLIMPWLDMATTVYCSILLQKYQCIHINPCGFVLWGFFKEKLYLQKPDALLELRALINQLYAQFMKFCVLRW